MADLLQSFGLAALVGSWFVELLTRRRRPPLFVAAADAVASVGFSLADERFLAAGFAVLCALYLHDWWHGGGGSGTRRRLRSLASRFRPARRTAPVVGA